MQMCSLCKSKCNILLNSQQPVRSSRLGPLGPL
uniref:Uncharacterized protein n=1 Tax=Anguilla anguilla TaxID=7936 RepID=A0A0E9SWP5_ANGAN